MAGKLDVEIVTGERVVFREEDVDMVVAPGGAGELGILPQHAPLITTLSLGELRIKKGNEEESILVYGGFLEVTTDKVLVLADSAERAEEVDIERAEAARRRAEESIASRQSTIELQQAQAALRQANLRLRLGQRRGPRRAPIPSGDGFSGG
jgi:F-type H+-transporting ATPase subunit epsilon